MHRIGIPLGDKVIKGLKIPDFIMNGPLEVQVAYLQEVIPEDGSITFAVYGGLKILWGRTVVLHEERESKRYAGQRHLKRALIQLVKDHGEYEKLRQCYRLSAGKLSSLKKYAHSKIANLATELEKIVRDNESTLLLDERDYARD